MRRGQVWTVSAGGEYAGKPRPAVVIQDNAFDATASVTICIFTMNPVEAPLFRIRIEPDERNGLRAPSSLMVDKITTISREKLGAQVGVLSEADMIRLNQSMLVFLGLARSSCGSTRSDM